MSDKREMLPQYDKPPVVEVVCGVQFGTLAGFSAVHYGQFWQRIKGEYPNTEDQAPLPEILERLPAMPKAEFLTKLPLPRVFYKDQTDNFLIQVQPNRFHANWRKKSENDVYPTFKIIKERFTTAWHSFLGFLEENKIGGPTANLYELQYVNHVLADSAPISGQIEKNLPIFSWTSGRTIQYLPAPESVMIRLQVPVPENKGSLHVTVGHGPRPNDGKQTIVLDLVVRGTADPLRHDMEGWFSTAHEFLVQGFTDLTSATAHESWGLRW